MPSHSWPYYHSWPLLPQLTILPQLTVVAAADHHCRSWPFLSQLTIIVTTFNCYCYSTSLYLSNQTVVQSKPQASMAHGIHPKRDTNKRFRGVWSSERPLKYQTSKFTITPGVHFFCYQECYFNTAHKTTLKQRPLFCFMLFMLFQLNL